MRLFSITAAALLTLTATGALAVEITASGSTTVQPLAELLAERYESTHSGVDIIIQGGGSSVGVKSIGDGTSDIGMVSREIKQSEFTDNPGIVAHVIARDGIAIVAFPGQTPSELTADEVRSIFSGSITNWNEVGGPDMGITVVAREEGSGTRAAFEEIVMGEEFITLYAILQPSNGAVRTTVATTPGSIAFLSFGYLDDSTTAMRINGAAPTPSNAANGSYPIVRPLIMVTQGNPTGAVSGWLNYILSDEGQAIVASEGYLSVN
jgi:phosphate transport system substrate-binding protein